MRCTGHTQCLRNHLFTMRRRHVTGMRVVSARTLDRHWKRKSLLPSSSLSRRVFPSFLPVHSILADPSTVCSALCRFYLLTVYLGNASLPRVLLTLALSLFPLERFVSFACVSSALRLFFSGYSLLHCVSILYYNVVVQTIFQSSFNFLFHLFARFFSLLWIC